MSRDSYATYYILSSKSIMGMEVSEEVQCVAEVFLNRLETSDEYALMDIYYTLLLCDDIKISDNIKGKISRYVDSLKTSYGYYVINESYNVKNSIDALLPTYMAVEILKKIDEPLNGMDTWLDEIETDIIANYKNNIEYIGIYKKYIDIMSFLGKQPNNELNPAIIFSDYQEYILNNKTEISSFSPIVLAALLKDFLMIAESLSDKTYIFQDIITDLFFVNGRIKPEIVNNYDAFSYNSVLECASKVGINCSQFNNEIENFNKFQLHDYTYLLPGYIESDLHSTLNVTNIINTLDLDISNNVIEYMESIKTEVLLGNIFEVYLYLHIIENINGQSLIKDIKSELYNECYNAFNSYMIEGEIINPDIIKLYAETLDILNDGFFDEEIKDRILSSLKTVSEIGNIIPDTYNNSIILDVINIIGYEGTYKNKVISELEEGLSEIIETPMSSKVLLLSQVIESIYESGQNVQQYKEDTLELICLSQHPSGLFKTGNTSDDVASFDSTAKALVLLKIMKYPLSDNAVAN